LMLTDELYKIQMTYPQAPWMLYGYAIQTVHLIDIEKARPLIPKELEIVSIWPGKTLGGVYISSYKSGSVLEYSELIVIPAVVSNSGKIGGWVSHIYVDNSDSVAGGREIWGLPKELAEFSWVKGEQSNVTVISCPLASRGDHPHPPTPSPIKGEEELELFKGEGEQELFCTTDATGHNISQENRQLCSLSYSHPGWRLPMPLSGEVFSTLGADLLLFKGEVKSRLGLISSQLDIPVASPFASLNLGQPWLTVYCDDLRLEVDAPKLITGGGD
jgi:acetoacetate decarboxylase